MPVITIHQSPGRTVEQRQLLIKRITDAVGEIYHVELECVTVLFQNYEDDHWGQGGVLHMDRVIEKQK